jgi:hypothetical protein
MGGIDVRHMKGALLTLLRHTFENGQSPANKLCLYFPKIKLGLIPKRKGFNSLVTIPKL